MGKRGRKEEKKGAEIDGGSREIENSKKVLSYWSFLDLGIVRFIHHDAATSCSRIGATTNAI